MLRIRRSWKRPALGALALAAGLAGSCSLEPLPCQTNCGTGGSGGSGPFKLSASVELKRDDLGMVHVYGKTANDTLYASGYAQAVDRLYQMELQKRHAQGRQAEIFGDGRFDDDRIVRVLGIPDLGHANAENLKKVAPDVYALVDAWVAGVNRRIDEVLNGKATLPTGFAELDFKPEPWTVDDAMAIGKLIVFGNGSQLEYDALATLITKYIPDLYKELTFYEPLDQEFILDTASKPLAGYAPLRSTSGGVKHDAPKIDAGAGERIERWLKTMARIHPGASNNFAVDGRYTANGHSMIAGDPHQALRSPSLMWMSHLKSADGALDVEGWSFVGTPGINLGHNRDIAWTATTNYPDVTDLFDVVVDDQGNVALGGKSVKLDSHVETVKVKGAADSSLTIDIVPGEGVLLPSDLFPLALVPSNHRVMLAWTGFRPTNEARAFVEIDRAKNVDGFDAAVDLFELGSFNFVAASRDAITYRSSPLVPDRGDPKTHPPAYVLLDGADPNAVWTGAFIPLDKLPHSRATDSGVIVTANNDPFGFTGDKDLTNDPFYFGAFYDPGLRSSRIHETLKKAAADHKLTLDDMQASQFDPHSKLADELVPLLDGAWAKVPTDDTFMKYRNRPELDGLVAMLDAWDHQMTREQAAPVAFEAFQYFLTKGVLADDMQVFFDPLLGQEPIYAIKFAVLALRDPSSPLLEGGRDALVLDALDKTAAFLTSRFGSTTTGFQWKDFHQTAFPSESIGALDGGTVATDGGEGTVNVSSGSFFDGDNVAQHHVSDGGSIYRMVASFDDAGVAHAKFNMPRGNAGEPTSKYFNNLTDDWANGRYKDMLFDDDEVQAHTDEQSTLEP